MSSVWFVCFLLLAPKPDPAHATAFDSACQAFDAGHWEAAEAGFEGLVAEGLQSGWLAYNLGNSHLRAGKLGEAIASYRAALVDLPRHQDIQANLAFARKRVRDAVAPVEPAALLRTLFRWHYVLNFREALWTLGACSAVFWLGRLGRLMGRAQRACRSLSVLFGLASVLVGASLVVHLCVPTRLGVVVADEVEVRTTNQTQAPVRFVLHAGCETQVTAQLDGWVLVALSDGKQGWVPRQSLAVVEL